MIHLAPNGTLQESNDCHNPGGSKGGQFCGTASGAGAALPPVEPGTTPIPPGMVRGYHYTTALDAVLKDGLSTQHAKGSTYGEPNVIWMSSQKPHDQKSYVEVHVRADEIGIGRPTMSVQGEHGWRIAQTPTDKQTALDTFNAGTNNFALSVSHIPASRFVTHSKPWIARYHMLMKRPDIVARILTGTHDALAASSPDEHGPAIRAVKATMAARAK